MTSNYANELNVNSSLQDSIKLVSGLNVTFNTSYSGLGPRFVEAAKHRGLLISPWILNTKAVLMQYFKMGVYGLTTDHYIWMSDWAYGIKPSSVSNIVPQGTSRKLDLSALTYKRINKAVTPTIIDLDGKDIIAASGDSVTGVKKGTAHDLLRYTASLETGNTYDLYSEPYHYSKLIEDKRAGGTSL